LPVAVYRISPKDTSRRDEAGAQSEVTITDRPPTRSWSS